MHCRTKERIKTGLSYLVLALFIALVVIGIWASLQEARACEQRNGVWLWRDHVCIARELTR
jgi:hypothetical protein